MYSRRLKPADIHDVMFESSFRLRVVLKLLHVQTFGLLFLGECVLHSRLKKKISRVDFKSTTHESNMNANRGVYRAGLTRGSRS